MIIKYGRYRFNTDTCELFERMETDFVFLYTAQMNEIKAQDGKALIDEVVAQYKAHMNRVEIPKVKAAKDPDPSCEM